MSKYHDLLIEYYLENQIHPEHFNCPYQVNCRKYAYQGKMTETKMSMVGSSYGEKYPKIVVLSLDPPSGVEIGLNKRGEFNTPHQRMVEFVSSLHEKDNYSVDRPNPHWAMTQIIVKDLLELWGFTAQPNAAIVTESYSNRPIENVSSYFAHVNMAKCSMNNPGQRQAARVVHSTCSKAYLLEELIVLEPDILITQGATTNKILGQMFVGREILVRDLPNNEEISLKNEQFLWLPMHHPARQLKTIRNLWPDYLCAVKGWEKNNESSFNTG